ncbi:MAG: transcription antitermination factor NusB [Gammaproteobacteria bacterium]|nr:transcription antitermination factor NusB [Gammaproteobacteria bacterium]MDT8370868.1 transcription antitermination factor NusB [Gammaproteobacteria bacterium]
MAGGLPRSHARRAAVQALYQSLVNGQMPVKDGIDFITAENSDKMDVKYFTMLINGVAKDIETLDAELAFAVDRNLADIDPVESSVLRIAVYEFINRPEIPYRVVLNEAVELAKAFGGEKGHKYVNGVLDKMGSKLREVEYKAAKAGRAKK